MNNKVKIKKTDHTRAKEIAAKNNTTDNRRHGGIERGGIKK